MSPRTPGPPRPAELGGNWTNREETIQTVLKDPGALAGITPGGIPRPALAPPTTLEWLPVTFENSWVNYGSPWAEAAFAKDEQGFVHLRGLVKNGTASTTMFTLPLGYRSAADGSIIFVTHVGEPHAVGRIDVHSTGAVAHASGATGYVTLTGIYFYTRS